MDKLDGTKITKSKIFPFGSQFFFLYCDSCIYPMLSVCCDVLLQAAVIVVSLFVSSEHGFLVQDNFPMIHGCDRLLTLEIPFYYFVKKVV